MGFEYKDDLKELLPVYLDYLVSKGDLEERGDGFYTCPFCNSGNKQKNTAAFHVKGTRYNCFSCTKKGDIFDLVGHMEGLENNFAKHYNRTLKIMRPYLDGNRPEKSVTVTAPKTQKEEDYTECVLSETRTPCSIRLQKFPKSHFHLYFLPSFCNISAFK